MQKDQRARDNWALIRSIELANQLNIPICVVFIVTDKIKNNYDRHYGFMLEGLAETALMLRDKHIGFGLYVGNPSELIVEIATKLNASAIVTDQSHLQLGRLWRKQASRVWSGYFEVVEANLIVPIDIVAERATYGAYILRPKLEKLKAEFITDFPDIPVQQKWKKTLIGALDEQDLKGMMQRLDLRPTPKLVQAQVPGSTAAMLLLDSLLDGRLMQYELRGDPNQLDAPSGLSPYLHYGQIATQRIVYELYNSPLSASQPDLVAKFVDQILVWRELAANHVEYTAEYAQFEGLPAWSQATLDKHSSDFREYIYSVDEFERGKTHDELWNAAQMEAVKTGRMHNYMRMYWGKKILEWSANAQQAIEIAVYLNDKYELDGRDPNGYAGILWAIGGLHDRPWFERPVYGMVRYMNANGAAKKFNTQAYIDRINGL